MRRLMRIHRDERGFTMIELLMVLLVTAILMGLAIPSIQRQISRNNLRAAARELVEVMRSARDTAVNEGVPRYVLFTPPRTYRIYKLRETAPGTYAWAAERNAQSVEATVSFTAAGVTFPAMTGVPVTGVDVPADAAYFGTRGRYPLGQSGPFTILLEGGFGQTRTLTVYGTTGQVTGV